MDRRDFLRGASASPLVWGWAALRSHADVVEEEEGMAASLADVVVRRAKERCGPRANYRHMFMTATREVRRGGEMAGYEVGVCQRDIPCLIGRDKDAAAWFAVPADTPRGVLAAASRMVHERLNTAELDLDRSDESLADQVCWNWVDLSHLCSPRPPRIASILVDHRGTMGYGFTAMTEESFPLHCPMFPLGYLIGTRERSRRVAESLARRFETSPRIAMP